MELKMGLTTPGVLFTVISLLFVAYNSRFHSLSMLIRQMDGKTSTRGRGENLLNQILILKKRLLIIRKIQLSGIFSFILSLISIFSILFEFMSIGKVFFTLGIIFMIITLSLAMWEIFISTLAIELEIERHFESLGSSDYDSVI